MFVPEALLYSQEHEWVEARDGSTIRIGITDYAQDQLGDVVFVGLPVVGSTVRKEDVLVEIESTKSVGEVYAPAEGEVTAINELLASSPELVNQSPYEGGWLVELRIAGAFEDLGLMDHAAYLDLIG